MATWLTKSEPGTYSFADLQREGRTRWDGIRNPFARAHLRQMKRGDEILYYHTGAEKAVVGIARVASDPYPEPADEVWSCVDLEPVEALPRPVSLVEVKGDALLREMMLAKSPRLSVQPVTPEQRERVVALASQPAPPPPPKAAKKKPAVKKPAAKKPAAKKPAKKRLAAPAKKQQKKNAQSRRRG